jgi:hypothetical protein
VIFYKKQTENHQKQQKTHFKRHNAMLKCIRNPFPVSFAKPSFFPQANKEEANAVKQSHQGLSGMN